MTRTALIISFATLALSVGRAAAQVSPAPGGVLPPNYLYGYSPLVPAINTFPSQPRYSPSVGWYRSAFGPATVYAPPTVVTSYPTVVVTTGYSGVIVEEPTYSIYTPRPFRRIGWRR